MTTPPLPFPDTASDPRLRMTAGHLKFASGIAQGLTNTEAYALAYPRSKHPGKDASRLMMKSNPLSSSIEWEVQRLRREAEFFGGGTVMSILEKRMFLARVVRGTILGTPHDSDLWAEIVRTRRVVGRGEGAQEWEVEKLRFPDKLKAIQLDNDLAAEGAQAQLAITITRAWAESEPPKGPEKAA